LYYSIIDLYYSIIDLHPNGSLQEKKYGSPPTMTSSSGLPTRIRSSSILSITIGVIPRSCSYKLFGKKKESFPF
ncbi:hypothetical protein KEH51_28890, partial [[Brevibacterium] frigoritolerans]|nr:hypothetical protein [Peribacillus frigoritolerans]